MTDYRKYYSSLKGKKNITMAAGVGDYTDYVKYLENRLEEAEEIVKTAACCSNTMYDIGNDYLDKYDLQGEK